MGGNPKLEKLQREAYNQEVGKYSFSCSGANTESNETALCTVIKPGVRLHFLRYGFFDKNSETENDIAFVDETTQKQLVQAVCVEEKVEVKNVCDDSQISSEEPTTTQSSIGVKEVEVLKIKEAPKLDNFYTGRTALREGYIYLMRDGDPDEYYELKVDENGFLSHILWEYSKDKEGNYLDVRKSENEKLTYKLVEPGKKMWVAFSRVQWSREYHNSLNTNSRKRKKRMTLLDCSGIPIGEEIENEELSIQDYKAVQAIFPEKHLYTSSFQGTLHDIHADERRQDEEDESNEVYEDMFITFHDPVGCATDIANVLADKVANLEALVESLGSGKNPKDIKDRILRGEEKPEIKKGSEEEQLSTLVATALTTYQLVYNDPSMIEEYDGGEKEGGGLRIRPIGAILGGNRGLPVTGIMPYWEDSGIYKQKLIDILAVKERRKLREAIVNYRYDFAVMLESEYYTKYFKDFRKGGFAALVEGSNLCSALTRLLSISPDSIDSYLDLKEHRGKYEGSLQKKHDDAKEYFVKHVKDNKKVHQILKKDLDLSFFDENEGVINTQLLIDLANKTAMHISQSLEAYVALAKVTEKDLKFVVDKLKRFKLPNGKTIVEFRKKELWKILEESRATPDKSKLKFVKQQNPKKIGSRVRYEIGQIEILSEYQHNGKNKVKFPAKVAGKKTAEQVKGAQRVLKNIYFSKGLCFLQVLNISSAGYQVYDNLSLKSFTNLAGISAELSSAILNLKNVHNASRGIMVSESMIKKASDLAKVGSFITAAVCFWESYDSFGDRDNDSAIAWLGAGALFLAGIWVTGPIGWVIGGVAIGLVYLANYLKDTPLQKYFKAYWLSDLKALPRNDKEAPYQYIKRVYDNRDSLIIDEDEYREEKNDWRDLRVCHQQLLDLMVCNAMFVSEIKLGNPRSFGGGGDNGRAGFSMEISDIVKVSIQTNFRQFLWLEEQFKHEVYIVNTRTGAYEKLEEEELNSNVTLLLNKKDRPIATKTTFTVPPRIHRKREKDRYTATYQLLFVCQLTIDETTNQHYPHTYVGNPRFMGIKMQLSESKITGVRNMEGMFFTPEPTEYKGFYYKNVKVDTLDNLRDWAKYTWRS